MNNKPGFGKRMNSIGKKTSLKLKLPSVDN